MPARPDEAGQTPLAQTQAAQPAETFSYPPPGELIDVGGWRLHLNCTGDNSGQTPTVVLESGSGDFSFDWSLVQPDIARLTRVCSYDRAGNAWSDPGPRPRTLKQMVYELHTVLTKAGIQAPYVLVGHSIGGLLVRTFASQYPQEVVGMILVDSTHEDARLNVNGQLQRVRDLSQGRSIPPIQTVISPADQALSGKERQQIQDFLTQFGPPKIEPPFTRLSPETQQVRLWALAQPEHYAAEDDSYWGEEFAEIYSARQTGTYPLGDIPLIVLTRGQSEDANPELNAERTRLQLDLLQLSRNSKQIIAEASGHHIQLDDPALVIEAVREVILSVTENGQRTP